jgi:hypothetical protein
VTSLEDRIIAMEQRVLNARTIEAARNFHDQLDRLYEERGDHIPRSRVSARPGKRGPARTVSADYERGYQAGYHAGQRQITKREDCNHEGIGLPWCPTCRPKTIASLREMGVEWIDRMGCIHDAG